MDPRLLLFSPVLLLACRDAAGGPTGPGNPQDPPAAGLPDLVIWQVEAASEAVLGGSTAFSVEVANTGVNTVSAGWLFRVVLSGDRLIDQEDLQFDRFIATRKLPPGGVDRYRRTTKVNVPLEPGEYYLGVTLDPSGMVTERTKQNNSAAAPSPLRLLRSPLPEEPGTRRAGVGVRPAP